MSDILTISKKNEEKGGDPCSFNEGTTTSSSSITTLIHCNTATEQQATNEGAGGSSIIIYNKSSNTPTLQPSTLRPTRNSIPFVLSGTLYYDLNANSRRENKIAALAGERYLGSDVEYSVGLGGVTVQLVECRDGGPSTAADDDADDMNDEKSAFNDDEEEAQVVTAVTIGVNVQGRPKLITSGGDYNLVDIKVDRSYYINVKAPMGYLLTGGVCNDEIGGWECNTDDYDQGGLMMMSGGRQRRAQEQQQEQDDPKQQLELLWQHNETKLGIPEGRSSKCVSVDKAGLTDSTLDIGVMRLGDVITFVVGYNVILDRDDDTMTTTITTTTAAAAGSDIMKRTRRRRMQIMSSSLDDEKVLPPPKDLDAIRDVVTEIFAVNLQKTLEQRNLSFVQIDEVLSLDVQYRALDDTAVGTDDDDTDDANDDGSDYLFGGTERDATQSIVGGTTRNIFQNIIRQSGMKDDEDDFFVTHSLSVDLIVKGHYRKDMEVNIHDGTTATTIEKLIQNVTSGNANRDEELLQDLLEYNPNCLEQMTKMKEPAFTLDDYSEVHSSKGILKLSSPGRGAFNSNGPNVFSAACANGSVLGFLMNDQEADEEVEVVTTTKVEESQGAAFDKGSTASVENAGSLPPWLRILLALICAFVAVCLVVFFVRRRRRRSAHEKDKSITSTTPSKDERGTLFGLFSKKSVVSDDTEFYNIEAGVEGGDKLDDDDDKLSTTDDVSGFVVEESDKEHLTTQPKKYNGSGDEEDKLMDQLDKDAVNAEMDSTTEDNRADASNLGAHATSLNLDSSDSKRMRRRTEVDRAEEDNRADTTSNSNLGAAHATSLNLDSSNSTRRRKRRPTRLKSNSDFANEPSQGEQHDNTLRRSICDLDIGTKRMKDNRGGNQDLSALILGDIVADYDNNKKSGHESRGHRRRATVNNLQYERDKSSNDRRRRRVQEDHQVPTKFSSTESSRRRGRKHDPLRRSIDDSNIGLRSRGTSSTLNAAPPKGSRRKSRKPDPLRKSQDDSNLGLRTAGAEATNIIHDAKKTSRRKGRKHDPLRMSQDDSNLGLRTAGAAVAATGSAAASNINNAKRTSRRKGRKHDPLRMSQDDSNLGLRTAGAAVAATGSAAASNINNAKRTSRRKGRKHDPLRMSQDDSNLGLRTAREKATKSDSDGRRKRGRRQDPLRRSRCDLDIGTKSQSSENIPALKDRSSSKSERHKHDRRKTTGDREKRPSLQRSSSNWS